MWKYWLILCDPLVQESLNQLSIWWEINHTAIHNSKLATSGSGVNEYVRCVLSLTVHCSAKHISLSVLFVEQKIIRCVTKFGSNNRPQSLKSLML